MSTTRCYDEEEKNAAAWTHGAFPPPPDNTTTDTTITKMDEFWAWAEEAKWGDKASNVDYFTLPFALVYAAIQAANLGIWMLSIFGVLAAIINRFVYSTVLVLTAMSHNISELLIGLHSVTVSSEKAHDKILLAVAALVLMLQIHLIIHQTMNIQVTLTIVIGDAMHYVAFCLLIVGALTESNHYWWMVGALFSHHAYDLLVYLRTPYPDFVVKQYWALYLNTVAIALAFTCCVISSN